MTIMASEELEARIVKLSDGDILTIHGPAKCIYTHFYQNGDTRALDQLFGMDEKPIPKGDIRLYELAKSVGPCSLGKTEVEDTLEYFVKIAARMGVFCGLREEEVQQQIGLVPILGGYHISLNYTDGGQGPYLIRKEVEGYPVLFPRNLPKLTF